MLATRKLCSTTISRSICRPHVWKGVINGISVASVTSSSVYRRAFSRIGPVFEPMIARKLAQKPEEDASYEDYDRERPEHAVISTFDLFSIGGE